MPSDLEKARLVVIYGFVVLIVGVVILDRIAPALLTGYEPLGDAALGLLLGSVTALIVGEGVTRAIGRDDEK